MKKIFFAILFVCLLFFNVQTIEQKNLFIELNTNPDKKAQFDKIIEQLQEERQNYYKLFNEWQKEKTKLNEEIDFISKEIKLLDLKISEEQKKEKDIEQQIKALNTEVKGNTQTIYTPIFYNVLEELEEIIKNDLPFKKEQRLEEILIRKKIINDENISLITKFNSVYEIAFKELSFTSNNEVFEDKIVLSNKTELVKFIRLGKIGLYFISNNQIGIYINNNWIFDLPTNIKNNIFHLSDMLNNIKPNKIILLPFPDYQK